MAGSMPRWQIRYFYLELAVAQVERGERRVWLLQHVDERLYERRRVGALARQPAERQTRYGAVLADGADDARQLELHVWKVMQWLPSGLLLLRCYLIQLQNCPQPAVTATAINAATARASLVYEKVATQIRKIAKLCLNLKIHSET